MTAVVWLPGLLFMAEDGLVWSQEVWCIVGDNPNKKCRKAKKATSTCTFDVDKDKLMPFEINQIWQGAVIVALQFVLTAVRNDRA